VIQHSCVAKPCDPIAVHPPDAVPDAWTMRRRITIDIIIIIIIIIVTVCPCRKIFGDPLQIFSRIPGLLSKFEEAVRLSIKESISREDFVELIESTGLYQADLRDLC
jgi:hypothetical protein